MSSSVPVPVVRRDSNLPLGVTSESVGGGVRTIILHRPDVKNCVDGPTARALYAAFLDAETDPECKVIVLYGAGGTFCAGADLSAVSKMDTTHNGIGGGNVSSDANPLLPVQPLDPLSRDPHSTLLQPHTSDIGPMGPTRLMLTKPTIAAIAGHAVAGGLELACWCDLRVAEESATAGVLCRRFGVPLIDGGTVRLPRLIGQSRAMDMILTGRSVGAKEAESWGLFNRVVPVGSVRSASEDLARSIAAFPHRCMQIDRWSAIHQSSKPMRLALEHEFRYAEKIVREEGIAGAKRFVQGQGRHGGFEKTKPSSPPSSASPLSLPPSSSPSSSPFRGVWFDLGGVVVDSPVSSIHAFESSHGLPPNSINLLLGRSSHFHQLERGELELKEFCRLFESEAKSRAGIELSASSLFRMMGSVQPRRETVELIHGLRQRGFIVVAVTNTWKDPEGCLAHHFPSTFDGIVESCLEGMRKPESRIWQRALERTNQIARERRQSGGGTRRGKEEEEDGDIQPHEIIFLDDLGTNLKSAQQFGLKTLKVGRDYHQAIRELKQTLQQQHGNTNTNIPKAKL